MKATEAAQAEKAKADGELAEAIPAMREAENAVNCLELSAIQELKGLGSPPAECQKVAEAVMILVTGEKKNLAWPNAQKMMKDPPKFLNQVKTFDGNNID